MATYRFGRLLGEGGFGQVFEVTRLDDGYKCVAKRVSPDCSQEDIQRFLREVRITERLDHPNVVQILGKNTSNELPWYIMPRAQMNLEDYLRDTSGEEELWVFSEILMGIDHAH